jgi:DNA replication protein DnaC
MEKLLALKLTAFAAAWGEQQKNPDVAKLRLSACIEDIDYSSKRELDKSIIRQLATGRWVQEHHNVVITGATGTGKTYVACALAHAPCSKGYRALYRRARRLFDELMLARADGSYARLLAGVAKIDVLVIDDWGLVAIKDQERRDLLELLEDRCGARSTIITSQLPPAKWHDHLGDPTMADAICDRVLHQRAPAGAKGAVSTEGGDVQGVEPSHPASLRSDHEADLRDPDRAISVITMAEMRIPGLRARRAAAGD